MLVYGDLSRPAEPLALWQELQALLAGLAATRPGLLRHEALVAAFLAAAELATGLADADFSETGIDRETPAGRLAMDWVLATAAAVARSWASGFEDQNPPFLADPASPFPPAVRCKLPEGYCHYALYPEAYFEAARRACVEAVLPVGIRSIGLGLAAMVQAGFGKGAPLSVRPHGHPFRREINLTPELAARLAAHGGDFAVVDEGPGLSGSSFGAVLDLLQGIGVPESRIRVFPSHGGEPGAMADGAGLARWRRLRRQHVAFDDLLLAPDRLPRWVADRVGQNGRWSDISGGAWRVHRRGEDAPPADAARERRKFLLDTADGSWLAKFAGLGRYGAVKAARAGALADAGFSPETRGLCHGFLVERWIEGARPVDPQADRAALVPHLAAYLAFRAGRFPAEAHDGAGVAALSEMLHHNAGEALQPELAACITAYSASLRPEGMDIRRVATDNRLHAWEWLATPDGRFFKTDAVDHAAAHDLVGCQDVAWDIAGAVVEFSLDDDVAADLVGRLERLLGRRFDPAQLLFHRLAYLAFQLGLWTMAVDANGAGEAGGLRARAGSYRRQLADIVKATM
jgi:hypothetical protein